MADFSINAELKANASNFVSELKKGETSVNSFGGVVDKILGPKGKLIMAITAATAAAIKFGQAMNESMSEIAKGTGATGEELYKLRENAHDALVEGVARSAKEVGTMIADLNTRFGATGDEVVQLTKDFDKFAKVTNTDTKTAINLTADVMAKWDIELADSNKLLDQLTKASQLSGAGVQELLSGLKQGAAVFSEFGMSATDTIAFMSSLKSNGIETSQALIAMRTALAKFSEQGINAQEGFKQVSDAIKNATSQTEALNIATSVFGTKNGAEMVKVLQSGASSAEDFTKEIMNAGGAVEKTAEAARTSKDAVAELTSVFKGTFGGLAEGLDSLFKGIVDTIKRVLQLIDPIIRPILNVCRDVLSTVGEIMTELANLAGDTVENGMGFKMLAASLQSAYETIHNILANLLEAFKAAFGLIFAIMNGKWELAWLNLKKIFVVMAKAVLDLISDFLNSIKDQINIFIEKVVNPFIEKLNWVQEKLGKEKTEKAALIENFDLSKAAGITESLENINKEIEKASKKTSKLTGDIGQAKKATNSATSEAKSDINDVNSAINGLTNKFATIYLNRVKKGFSSISKGLSDIEDKTEQFATAAADVTSSAVAIMTDSFADMFTSLGEELADGELSFENYAATAVEGIAKVLSSLGSELLALAAARAANHDFGTAALAAVGAAAAFTASGVLSGVAKALKKSAEAAEIATESLEAFEEALEDITSTDTISGYMSSMNQINNLISAHEEALVELNNTLQDQHTAYDKLVSDYKSQQAFIAGITAPMGAFGWLVGSIATVVNSLNFTDKLKEAQSGIDATESEIERILSEIEELNEEINKLGEDVLSNIKATNDQLREEITNYAVFYSGITDVFKNITTEIQTQGLLNNLLNVMSDFQSAGATIGEKFVDGLINGVTEQDFSLSLKDYVRENMIKLSVYTEEYSSTIAAQASELVEAITTNNVDKITSVKTSLQSLYAIASEQQKAIDSVLDDIFGKVEETVEDISDTVTDAMEQIGNDISNSLVDSISNGLDSSNFLETMKKYLRKMVIQTVVYTDTLQGEIQAIGEALSAGIAEGFTETGLHELRRDFSYIFYQAENAMSKVDSIMNAVFDGYASGTSSATKGLHLVGEAGPEIVRFKGGEQVYNASDTRKMLSGGSGSGNNFNITFNNMQDTSAYAMMNQLKQYQRQMAINGVL